jgi:hypothetical protein
MSALSTPDISINSDISTPSGQNRPRTALTTWAHSRPPNTPSEPIRHCKTNAEIWYCKYCTNYSAISLTTARRHLQTKHEIAIPVISKIHRLASQGVDEIYLATGITRQNYDSKVLKSVINKKAILEAFVRLIVRHDLPFRAIQWLELHTLLQIVNPAIAIATLATSHSTVSKIVQSSWASASDSIR